MTTKYENLLVAIDGSNEAECAFKKSIEIALRNNATLHIANIVDTHSLTSVKVYDSSIEEHAFEFGKELVGKYKQQAEEDGVQKVTSIVIAGSPKHIIPQELATKVKADLIICGAAGLNAIERFILGSVSENIVRQSPCDVLVVRKEEHAKANA